MLILSFKAGLIFGIFQKIIFPFSAGSLGWNSFLLEAARFDLLFSLVLDLFLGQITPVDSCGLPELLWAGFAGLDPPWIGLELKNFRRASCSFRSAKF